MTHHLVFLHRLPFRDMIYGSPGNYHDYVVRHIGSFGSRAAALNARRETIKQDQSFDDGDYKWSSTHATTLYIVVSDDELLRVRENASVPGGMLAIESLIGRDVEDRYEVTDRAARVIEKHRDLAAVRAARDNLDHGCIRLVRDGSAPIYIDMW